MRQFIKSLLLYIPVCCLTYILLVCIWGEFIPVAYRTNLSIENRNQNTSMRLHDLSNYEDIDILFLGSSRAFSGFDTRMYERLGYSAFNMGTSSQTPIQTKVLLERYLDVLKPELIIFEVSPSMFSSDGVESSTDIIANGRCDMAAVKMGIKSRHIKVLNTLIFRLYTKTFKRNTEPEAKRLNYDRRYMEGGFLESDQMEYKPLKLASVPRIENMNPDQIKEFEYILDMIKSRQTRLILLQVPFTPDKYESHHAINPVFDQQMNQYGEYYNLNETMHLVDTIHFRDDFHLNLTGVGLLNERVIHMLDL